MYVHLPFVVRCCVHAWALLANCPCPSGTLVGNLLCYQDISNGLLLLLNGISPLVVEEWKGKRTGV